MAWFDLDVELEHKHLRSEFPILNRNVLVCRKGTQEVASRVQFTLEPLTFQQQMLNYKLL